MTISKILLCVAMIGMWPAYSVASDRKTYHAMTTCQYFLRNQVPEFEDLPSEAVTVSSGTVSEAGVYSVNWVVKWDSPAVRAAGSCQVRQNEIIGFETSK